MSKAVIYFASSAHVGLTNHCCRQICDIYELMPDDCDFYVVSSDKEQNEGLWKKAESVIPAGRIIKIPGELKRNPRLTTEIRKIVDKYDKVFFHFHGMSQVLECRKLLRMEKCSSLMIVNSFANGTWKRPFVSFIHSLLALRFLDHMIFLSPFAWRSFAGSKWLFRRGIAKYIPFVLPPAEVDEEHAPKLPRGMFNAVCFASYFKNKGHERFLPGLIAFSQHHDDVMIHFYGNRNDLASKLEKRIAAAGCSSKILCHDRVPLNHVPAILEQASVALSLSKSENAGHAGVEAMMKKVPVVGTRVGSMEYLIQDGLSGFGVSNAEQLREALETLYSLPELRESMGEYAQRSVCNIFDYSAMLQGFIRLYKDF